MAPRTTEVESTDDLLADLLAEVANVGLVAVPVATLAATLGETQRDTWEALGDAEAAGLVARWECPKEGRLACLSPWSVERLGLKATADGRRWIRLGDPDPTVRKPRHVAEGEPGGAFDADTIGHRPVEGLAALVAEEDRHRQQMEAIARFDRPRRPRPKRTLAELNEVIREGDLESDDREEMAERVERLPRMIYFAGFDRPWPIAPTEGGKCGGCGGRQLDRLETCLVCDRSGIDGWLRPVTRAELARPRAATVAEKVVIQARPARRVAVKVAGGTERAPAATPKGWDRALDQLRAMRGGRGHVRRISHTN